MKVDLVKWNIKLYGGVGGVVRQRNNIIPGCLSKFVTFMNELKMKTFISNSTNLKTLVNSICSLQESLVQFVFVVFKYQSYPWVTCLMIFGRIATNPKE